MLFSPLLATFYVVLAQVPKSWEDIAPGRCVVVTKEGVEVATIQGFECIFANVVSIAVVLAGLAVFLMLIVGGFKYLTSGGDPKATESAQKTMTYAIVGLVVIIAAYLILRFLAVFTGIPDLLKFTIPGPE